MMALPNTARQRVPLPPTYYVALLTTVLFAFSITLLLPVIALYITDELNAAEHWIGTATVAVTALAVSTRIPAGTLSDRHGRRRLMLIGAALSVAAGVLYIFSFNLPIFLLARMLSGAGLGLFTSANKALIADLAPPSRRGEALGMSNAAFSVAIVASPLLSEWLMNTISYQAVFVASTVLAAACLLLTYTLPRVKPTEVDDHNFRHHVQQVFRVRGSWAANIMMLGLGTILSAMFTFYPLLAERKELFEDAPRLIASIAMGMGLSIWALTDTVIEPVAGWISDHIGRQPVAIPGLTLTVIGLLALSRAHDTASAYLAIALLASGWGITRAIADSMSQDAVAPALRGISAAIVYTSFDLSVGINAQVLGSLIEGNDFTRFFQAAMLFLLVFCVPGILLATRARSYEQRLAHPVAGD